MEYLTIAITPTPDGAWKASPYVKATMPAIHGHPRTLQTYPDVHLPGLRGLSVGAVAGVVRLTLPTLGSLPLCARCQDVLPEGLGQ